MTVGRSSRHPRILADLIRNKTSDKLLQLALASVPDGGVTAPPDVSAVYVDALFVIDGGGAVPAVGVALDLVIDFDAEIVAWTLLADVAGDLVLDLWKDSYASFPPTIADTITAAAKPTLSSASSANDTALTGWDTTIAAGETIRLNIDSVATITRATLALKLRRL